MLKHDDSKQVLKLKILVLIENGVFQAEEITLTIGQAFDLAYKKFLESGGKDVETRKQIASLQKRVGTTFYPFTTYSFPFTRINRITRW